MLNHCFPMLHQCVNVASMFSNVFQCLINVFECCINVLECFMYVFQCGINVFEYCINALMINVFTLIASKEQCEERVHQNSANKKNFFRIARAKLELLHFFTYSSSEARTSRHISSAARI